MNAGKRSKLNEAATIQKREQKRNFVNIMKRSIVCFHCCMSDGTDTIDQAYSTNSSSVKQIGGKFVHLHCISERQAKESKNE